MSHPARGPRGGTPWGSTARRLRPAADSEILIDNEAAEAAEYVPTTR